MPTAETKVEEKPKKQEPTTIKDMTKEERHEAMKSMPPPEGYVKGPVDIKEPEPEKAEPKKEEAKSAEAKKPEEKKQEEKPEERDVFLRLETELNKPEGKEDLSDFSPREKAYFYQMRRDRKNRQKAERDRDQALFNLSKTQKEASQKKEDPVEEDPFKDRDPNDFLTVEEARKLLTKKPEKKQEEKKEEPETRGNDLQLRYLKMCEKEAKEQHEDFEAVVELTGELLDGNSEGLAELKDRVEAGENPALVMYEIIKNHRDFETLYPAAETRVKARIAAKAKPQEKAKEEKPPVSEPKQPDPDQVRKEQEASRAQEKLEKNSERPKTTAHAPSREGKPTGEMTIEEYTSMSDLEFAKLPKAVREKALKKYGA